jgi:hypothetical protein
MTSECPPLLAKLMAASMSDSSAEDDGLLSRAADAEDVTVGVADVELADVPRLVGRWVGDLQPGGETTSTRARRAGRPPAQVAEPGDAGLDVRDVEDRDDLLDLHAAFQIPNTTPCGSAA